MQACWKVEQQPTELKVSAEISFSSAFRCCGGGGRVFSDCIPVSLYCLHFLHRFTSESPARCVQWQPNSVEGAVAATLTGQLEQVRTHFCRSQGLSQVDVLVEDLVDIFQAPLAQLVQLQWGDCLMEVPLVVTARPWTSCALQTSCCGPKCAS